MDLSFQAHGTVEDPSGGTPSGDHSCRRNQTAMEDASFEVSDAGDFLGRKPVKLGTPNQLG